MAHFFIPIYMLTDDFSLSLPAPQPCLYGQCTVNFQRKSFNDYKQLRVDLGGFLEINIKCDNLSMFIILQCYNSNIIVGANLQPSQRAVYLM